MFEFLIYLIWGNYGFRFYKVKRIFKRRYRPSEDEPFMNENQADYFRGKLLDWKKSILSESKDTIKGMKEETRNIPDVADRASEETDRALELRTRDRQRKLISKIDAALRRIEDGSYGYCEETGEPISLKRLDARPIATLSVEAQERMRGVKEIIGTTRLEENLGLNKPTKLKVAIIGAGVSGLCSALF